MSAFPDAAAGVVDAFEPIAALTATFGTKAVHEGESVSPGDVSCAPTLAFGGSNDKLYTFALTDPDAPNPAEPKFAEWVHWLSVNRGASGAGGDDLVAFFGSAPGQGAGIHRYVLVVYEQAAPIHSSEPRIPLRSGFPPRRSFNSRAFAATHGLRPVAVLTYRASWDESVPGLVARIMPEA